MSGRPRPPLFAALAAIFALVAARDARATPNFPPAIKRELQLAAEPQCSLCHAGGVTGRGTVTTPFGTTMRSRGLVPYDEASLALALKALTAEKKDSDADGTPDIDELKANGDPNVNLEEPPPPPPEYGCATAPRSAVTAPASPFFAALAIVLAATLRTIRRRRA